MRVTGLGIDAVLDGCRHLSELDVSQCKNLYEWRVLGGEERASRKGCVPRFDVENDGSWRAVAKR